MTTTWRIAAGCVFVVALLGAPARAQELDEQIVSPFPEQAPPHQVLLHPHRQQRDKYVWGTFGPPGLLNASISAGFGQVLDTPKEWGQTREGYFKRFATEYTESSISQTTTYVLARLRDEDPSFRICSCSGFSRRFKHAVISPFIAYSYDTGQPQFSMAKVAGTTTSSVVSANTWKPGAPKSAGAQISHIGVDVLSAIGVDLVREFILHHRKLGD